MRLLKIERRSTCPSVRPWWCSIICNEMFDIIFKTPGWNSLKFGRHLQTTRDKLWEFLENFTCPRTFFIPNSRRTPLIALISKTGWHSGIKFGSRQEGEGADLCEFCQNFRRHRSAVPWNLIYSVKSNPKPLPLPVSSKGPECRPYYIHKRPPLACAPRPPPAPPPPSKYFLMY